MRNRRRFTREFKVSVVRGLEEGKTAAEICREHCVSPSMLYKWGREYRDNPQTAFSGNGNACGAEAKVAERERLMGQLYTENAFLKKVLLALETRLAELQRRG